MGYEQTIIFKASTHRSYEGLLPIVQWLISLERNPQPTRNHLTIERLQGWSMLAYYPLEHISYLCSRGIIPSTIPNLASLFSSSAKPITLNPNTLGIWSTRFWAFYVLLQFAHLREDRKLIQLRQRALRKAKSTGLTPIEKQELQQRWDAYWSELIANLGYLPLTIHWCALFELIMEIFSKKSRSLEKGIFKNEVSHSTCANIPIIDLVSLGLGRRLWANCRSRLIQKWLEGNCSTIETLVTGSNGLPQSWIYRPAYGSHGLRCKQVKCTFPSFFYVDSRWLFTASNIYIIVHHAKLVWE